MRELDSMYKEEHFLHKRDLQAYMLKQAGSCLYLIEHLGQWFLDTRNERIEVVMRYLVDVHIRQFDDIRDVLPLKILTPLSSFYFDSLVDGEISEYNRLATHLVSYERGRRRYEKLKVLNPFPWALFERDAACNRDLCMACLRLGLPHMYISTIDAAISREAALMQMIDERNGEK